MAVARQSFGCKLVWSGSAAKRGPEEREYYFSCPASKGCFGGYKGRQGGVHEEWEKIQAERCPSCTVHRLLYDDLM